MLKVVLSGWVLENVVQENLYDENFQSIKCLNALILPIDHFAVLYFLLQNCIKIRRGILFPSYIETNNFPSVYV